MRFAPKPDAAVRGVCAFDVQQVNTRAVRDDTPVHLAARKDMKEARRPVTTTLTGDACLAKAAIQFGWTTRRAPINPRLSGDFQLPTWVRMLGSGQVIRESVGRSRSYAEGDNPSVLT